MSARRPSTHGAGTARGRAAGRKTAGRLRWAIALAVVVVMLGVIAAQFLRQRPETAGGPSGLPGPIGGPEIAQDINTLVGKPAPAFTLPDSDGKRYTVTPGQGRPLVLISHMGVT